MPVVHELHGLPRPEILGVQEFGVLDQVSGLKALGVGFEAPLYDSMSCLQ